MCVDCLLSLAELHRRCGVAELRSCIGAAELYRSCIGVVVSSGGIIGVVSAEGVARYSIGVRCIVGLRWSE